MEQVQITAYLVWLDEQTKIASFHYVEGFQQQIFSCHAAFMDFLCGLQASGYRFQ